MAKNTGRKFAAFTVLAAAAGYLAGVLTAPKAGKESRQDIKDTAAKGVAGVEKQLQHVQQELKDLLEDAAAEGTKLGRKAKEELEDIVAKANDARDKTTEVMKAVRNGSADDKELQRALNQANAAIKNLRKYLSK